MLGLPQYTEVFCFVPCAPKLSHHNRVSASLSRASPRRGAAADSVPISRASALYVLFPFSHAEAYENCFPTYYALRVVCASGLNHLPKVIKETDDVNALVLSAQQKAYTSQLGCLLLTEPSL